MRLEHLSNESLLDYFASVVAVFERDPYAMVLLPGSSQQQRQAVRLKHSIKEELLRRLNSKTKA